MALRFQVIADFSFSGCRPLLVSLSLHSTRAACTSWPVPVSLFRLTSISRIFHTLKEAQSYTSYLIGRYPQRSVPFPVLDKRQNLLFKE
jgi:hypothetical protein